jgi:hypothetical protein
VDPLAFDSQRLIFIGTKQQTMSLLGNSNKKGKGKQPANTKNQANNNSKFIKPSSKSPNVTKKVRSTGANRGS